MCNKNKKAPFTLEDGYAYFGEFPCSLKAEDVEVGSEACGRGYYLGSDGRYYAKVVACPKGEECIFSSGDRGISGETYYFLVEPIRWRVLAREAGRALLFSDRIIASMAYQPSIHQRDGAFYISDEGALKDVFVNNYEHSSVRKWLNGDFLTAAFSADESEYILTTEVKNGPETLAVQSSDRFCCPDTLDKVFLLSFAESKSEELGFGDPQASVLATTDYAKATGAFSSMCEVGYGCGFWWLRSPDYNKSNFAMSATNSKTFARTMGLTHNTNIGVAPAVWVMTDD